MRYLRNASGALILASTTACSVLPEFAQELTDTQREQVLLLQKDTQAVTPVIESLIEIASPVYDEQGEPVTDSEVTIDAVEGVLADLDFYITDGRIYTYSTKDVEDGYLNTDGYILQESEGMFVDRSISEERYRDDYILLNRDFSNWDIMTLMHESAHRTDDHGEGYYEYIVEELNGYRDYNREYARWVIRSGDWAEMQTMYYGIGYTLMSDLNHARSQTLRYIEYSDDPHWLVDHWDSTQLLFESLLRRDYGDWQREAIEDLWTDNGDMDGFIDELGIPKQDFLKTIANEELYRYLRTEIEWEYERCREMRSEAQSEINQELRSEHRRMR
jgi:hypothetical protein